MIAKEHNRLVGIFLMAHGAMQALVMIFICVVYGIMGTAMFATAPKEGKFVGLIFIGMVAFIAFIGSVLIVPQILGGLKIYKERPGARMWGIVGSIVCCLSFPLGTAAGVYGLWFLFGDEGKRFYLGGMNQPAFMPNNYQPRGYEPPQPGAWQ